MVVALVIKAALANVSTDPSIWMPELQAAQDTRALAGKGTLDLVLLNAEHGSWYLLIMCYKIHGYKHNINTSKSSLFSVGAYTLSRISVKIVYSLDQLKEKGCYGYKNLKQNDLS
jgi:hypothetical protein